NNGLVTLNGRFSFWLALGNLNNGSNAGLWILNANNGWSNTNWYIVSGVSPNGTRGEWQAAA
ncbi:hypothetical protein LIR51_27080, partial [Blautia producta]|uniref:hypothetical protein n=1 Tax=Blautia producta TaxID=33035 RepID=UPI001D04110B